MKLVYNGRTCQSKNKRSASASKPRKYLISLLVNSNAFGDHTAKLCKANVNQSFYLLQTK